MFKVGDKVVPKSEILKRYSSILTKGKVYTAVKHPNYSGTVVYSDNGREYWSSPHDSFVLVSINVVGGKIL